MEKGGIVEWREWKDRGNALFQEKDYAGARAMYGKARLLALGPYRSGAVKAWFDALQAAPAHTARRQVFDIEPLVGQVLNCVEINQCVGCTKSFLGDDVAVLARSSGEEPASPRHRAGVASMAWRTNAP